jgi:hypothetical protein
MAQENEKQRRLLPIINVFLVAIFVVIMLLKLGVIQMPEKPIDNYIKYMWDNPPTCIASLSCKPDEQLEKALLAAYGHYSTVFGLKCSCGIEEFNIKGKDIETSDEGVDGPILVICKACRSSATVFDPNKHGYDSELGSGYSNSKLHDKLIKCPKCGTDIFRLALAFQYSGDEKQIIEEDHLNKKPQDLFGWLSGQARCQSCGHTFEFTSIECQ